MSDQLRDPNLDQLIRVAAVFANSRLELHSLGVDPARPPLVTRELVNGELVWNYGGIKVKMRRIEATSDPPLR